MGWDHGYHSAHAYTSGFYRELAPAWLDFAALLQGHPPPRRRDGVPFRYLDLGSGMGFGLLLLAALHPEAEFVGVDFHPDHILHSRRLAEQLGLGNVRFLEGDFLALAEDGSACGPGGSFDYVVAHGIATWITEPVQTALLRLAASCLRLGGLFYCSYNTHPGWLSASAFQQLVMLEGERHGTDQAAAAVRKAAATIRALLGPSETPESLDRFHPALRLRLDSLEQMDASYLEQEYMNAGWQPLYVAQMHRRCALHKLRFLSSATLPENFLDLLTPGLRETVLAEPDPLLRQSLLDLALNQSFRRDLFVRGRATLSASQLSEQLAQLRFRLLEQPEDRSYSFGTSFGTVNGAEKPYAALEEALQNGACGFMELGACSGLPQSDLALALSLLLHAGRLAHDRGESGEQALDRCQQVNAVLRRCISQGQPYAFLSAPLAGTAVTYSVVESLLEEAAAKRQRPAAVKTHLRQSLQQLGRNLLVEPDQAVSAYAQRRPLLQRLGVLTAAAAS